MPAGSGRPRDSSSVDPDFCVVATSLHRSPRESASRAARTYFPDLRRTARPLRTPLLQERVKSPAIDAGQFLVQSRLAPFAGGQCDTSTTHVDNPPDTITTSNEESPISVSTKDPTASGNTMNSDKCCCKPEGLAPAADISVKKSLGEGRRSTLSSIEMARKDDGPATAPAASVS